MALLGDELKEFDADTAKDAGRRLMRFINDQPMVGDLLSLDYEEAVILVHDAMRQIAGGLPMGCFLLATRMSPENVYEAHQEDASLVLLRVVGRAALSNQTDTAKWLLEAALRSVDSEQQWDADNKTDQFTLNQLRHAGVRCSIMGTFRLVQEGNGTKWHLSYGSDISNFYSGQGMKIYKPMGEALSMIVNFSKPAGIKHKLAGKAVPVGRVRYCSSEIAVDAKRENVSVHIEPTDMLARRTALFGMSRSGKSNTIKTIASSIFKLRGIAPKEGRVGQLIFDVNGEYCNDNPQDAGCLRNIGKQMPDGSREDVVTYGLFDHPNDENRRLIKVNFFGEEPSDWGNLDAVRNALPMLYAGKDIINDSLQAAASPPQYVKNFIATELDPAGGGEWDKGAEKRYRRNITLYRAILAASNFAPPENMDGVNIKGLFSQDFRDAMATEHNAAAGILGKGIVSWGELQGVLSPLQEFVVGNKQSDEGSDGFKAFNEKYRSRKGKPWNDDMLNGLLSLLKWPNGKARIRELQDRHSPSVKSDYATTIVKELTEGKLVIVDQSIGSPVELQHTSTRLMWELFNCQKQAFISPPRGADGELLRDANGDIKPPPDVIVYAEEAHNLLPAKDADLSSVWARVAKEGSKFRIGLVYSTQEPSSILSNILKNTDNWFVAHLNNQDETRELKKYYDFEMFVGQILKVPDTGFLRMRCLSNPYIVPVQINKFTAEPPGGNAEQQEE